MGQGSSASKAPVAHNYPDQHKDLKSNIGIYVHGFNTPIANVNARLEHWDQISVEDYSWIGGRWHEDDVAGRISEKTVSGAGGSAYHGVDSQTTANNPDYAIDKALQLVEEKQPGATCDILAHSHGCKITVEWLKKHWSNGTLDGKIRRVALCHPDCNLKRMTELMEDYGFPKEKIAWFDSKRDFATTTSGSSAQVIQGADGSRECGHLAGLHCQVSEVSHCLWLEAEHVKVVMKWLSDGIAPSPPFTATFEIKKAI